MPPQTSKPIRHDFPTKCVGFNLHQCFLGKWRVIERNSPQCGYIKPARRGTRSIPSPTPPPESTIAITATSPIPLYFTAGGGAPTRIPCTRSIAILGERSALSTSAGGEDPSTGVAGGDPSTGAAALPLLSPLSALARYRVDFTKEKVYKTISKGYSITATWNLSKGTIHFDVKYISEHGFLMPKCPKQGTKCIGYDLHVCLKGKWVLREKNASTCGYPKTTPKPTPKSTPGSGATCAEGYTLCKGYDSYLCKNNKWTLHKKNAAECGYVEPTPTPKPTPEPTPGLGLWTPKPTPSLGLLTPEPTPSLGLWTPKPTLISTPEETCLGNETKCFGPDLYQCFFGKWRVIERNCTKCK